MSLYIRQTPVRAPWGSGCPWGPWRLPMVLEAGRSSQVPSCCSIRSSQLGTPGQPHSQALSWTQRWGWAKARPGHGLTGWPSWAGAMARWGSGELEPSPTVALLGLMAPERRGGMAGPRQVGEPWGQHSDSQGWGYT